MYRSSRNFASRDEIRPNSGNPWPPPFNLIEFLKVSREQGGLNARFAALRMTFESFLFHFIALIKITL
jgi:hypothetical protein